jgi:phage/plasmid-associated DNA primase
MDPKLNELIQSCKKQGGISIANYCSLFGSLNNKFSISTNKFGSFMDEYCSIAYEDVSLDNGDGIPPKNLYVGEIVEKSTLPLIGNFKFKFHVEEGEEERSYFEMDLPLRLIRCYQKAMSELLVISSNLTEYICCVQQGHSYRKGEFIYINLIIQFPFCQLDINYTKKIFKPYVEKLFRQHKVLESFDTHPVGDWKEFMADNYEVIPLYRSTMEPNIPHNMFQGIYGIIEEEHIEKKEGPELDLKEVFKIGLFSFLYNGKIPADSIKQTPRDDEDEDEFYKYWLPLFLSIHYWSGQTNPKEILNNNKEQQLNVIRNPYEIDEMESDNPKRMIHLLLPLLNNDRAINDWSWLDIGRALYNIFDGDEEGLNIWINFSSRANCVGRNRSSCEVNYNLNFTQNTNKLITIKTIAWYAKQDNPESYTEWHNAWCSKSLTDALHGHHSDVSQAIYKVYWLEYVYSSITKDWYEYRNQSYYRIGTEPFSLRTKIISHFVAIFEKMRTSLSKDISDKYGSNDDSKERTEFKIKQIGNLIAKLKNETFRSTLIKACKDFFHYEEFERKCDKNVYLTALSNCVLEVVNEDKVKPRPGKPEDFITKTSKINYPYDYIWESHWVKEVNHWFDQITCRNEPLKRYFLKRLASFLRGQNNEKLFDVWTNEGNGGKSIVIKTLQYIFGNYCVNFPTSLLAAGGTKNSGAANPELAQAVNARAAIISEPDDRIELSSGNIKRITGGDTMFVRLLHDNGGTMDLTFKTVMVCNRIPDIANIDKALIRRFVIVPFLGTWCKDAPEDEENQFKLGKFKIDEHFDTKIPELAKGLLWLMVQYYPIYAQEKLEFPPIVEETIEKHWQDNDPYLNFISEKIEYAYKDNDKKEINTDVTLSMTDLYPVFSQWYKQNYPNRNVPTLGQARDDLRMSGRLGPQSKKNNWSGIKIKVAVPELGSNLGRGLTNI